MPQTRDHDVLEGGYGMLDRAAAHGPIDLCCWSP